MGLLDKIFVKEDKKQEETPEDVGSSSRICSACNQPGADKRFGGQDWHKKCLRKMRKMAKGMI